MQTRTLGRTGLDVTTVSFGTAPIGGLFGDVSEADAIRVVHEAIDAGVTFIDTSPYYGSAEERLGKALTGGLRDRIVLGTKAGRYGVDSFDFSAKGIRASVERSLRLLGTDHVDILQLHDIEFVDLQPVIDEGYPELLRLRDEGKCRFIGMTGYPISVFERVVRECDLDVVLTYAHGTLLDDSIATRLGPIADERGTGLINAAAVALGLLTPRGPAAGDGHPATPVIREAADRMRAVCAEAGVDIAFLANQYAIQRAGCPTTLVGTAKSAHLRSALEAADAPIDEDLLAAVLACRPDPAEASWPSGLVD
ncbi:aldo/keto reductase [Arsenicicoccus piscis]|uniref:Oxidoreductase n=1 Tax=Arsenicicoccus piscis TaxID=673954 RepID=A0ABQ6HT95_9MICO|nr:aldo/keto reductase [Arsenicicoccus piscis]MCH8627469.1 aldo/keto reductase [Arsenicicoccus piscis]GMA21636.1 oxidoreductase [Arsenicicoccus piscis]